MDEWTTNVKYMSTCLVCWLLKELPCTYSIFLHNFIREKTDHEVPIDDPNRYHNVPLDCKEKPTDHNVSLKKGDILHLLIEFC